jgi:hypothetical protein
MMVDSDLSVFSKPAAETTKTFITGD